MKKKRYIAIVLAAMMLCTLPISQVYASVKPSPVSQQSALARTASGGWWLKVNTQRNVVTAYKKSKGKYKAVRAMLCSTGTGARDPETGEIYSTPHGTFHTSSKYRWKVLKDEVWGQYCTRITGSILFHSVWYFDAYDKSSQSSLAFANLGYDASHGCVRLCCMDAKWVYENCGYGTRVTIYSSSKAGPLGKPKRVPVRVSGWDPTDPSASNPGWNMRPPKITIKKSKKRELQYGQKYTRKAMKARITVKNTNCNMNIKKLLRIHKIEKYNSGTDKWKKAKFTTRTIGNFRITFKVHDKYCGTSYKKFIVRVRDKKAPVITAEDRVCKQGDVNAVLGVSAAQKSGDRTDAINVSVLAPDETEDVNMTYEEALLYVFDKTGEYRITYSVKGKYKPYAETTKTITVTCEI